MFESLFNIPNWKNPLYIGVLAMGYTLYKFWGNNKPQRLLKWTMWILLPFLFGTIGAEVNTKILKSSMVGYAFGIFFFSTNVRFMATLAVALMSRYTL